MTYPNTAEHRNLCQKESEDPMSYLKDKLYLTEPVTEEVPATKYSPTLDSLIAWLETKDPAETYNWWDADKCLYGQFGKACGLGGHNFTLEFIAETPGVALREPHTFGSALERTRALKARG
jgi:hypothetical protein